jgi:hypothetical protein
VNLPNSVWDPVGVLVRMVMKSPKYRERLDCVNEYQLASEG